MSSILDNYTPQSGRMLREDGTVANIADAIAGTNALVYRNNTYTPSASSGSIAIPLPDTLISGSLYVISVSNSGAQTATVTVYNVEEFASDVDCKLTSFTVDAGATASQPVRGWFVGKSAKLGISSTANIGPLAIAVRKA